MEENSIFKELESVLKQLSIDLKFGRGYFEGGFYKYREKRIIFLNRAFSAEQNNEIIIRELKNINLNGINISPGLKDLILNSGEN